MKWFLILAALAIMAIGAYAHAGPLLVSDPNPGAVEYWITAMVPAQADGSLKWPIDALMGSGQVITIKACRQGQADCSVDVPFRFVAVPLPPVPIPTPPPVPTPPPPPVPPPPVNVTCGSGGCTLSVTYGGTGKGVVTASGWMAKWPVGTTVTLTARPYTGSKFTGWSGGCTGMASVCVLRITTNLAIRAEFMLQ